MHLLGDLSKIRKITLAFLYKKKGEEGEYPDRMAPNGCPHLQPGISDTVVNGSRATSWSHDLAKKQQRGFCSDFGGNQQVAKGYGP